MGINIVYIKRCNFKTHFLTEYKRFHINWKIFTFLISTFCLAIYASFMGITVESLYSVLVLKETREN